MPVHIKVINNHYYFYEQKSVRVAGKVKTPTKYIGPVRSLFQFLDAQLTPSDGTNAIDMEEAHRIQAERDIEKEMAHRQHLLGLYDKYGLTVYRYGDVTRG